MKGVGVSAEVSGEDGIRNPRTNKWSLRDSPYRQGTPRSFHRGGSVGGQRTTLYPQSQDGRWTLKNCKSGDSETNCGEVSCKEGGISKESGDPRVTDS